MAATITKQETLVVETEFEVSRVEDTDFDEFEAPIALPWYRRVPAPGIPTSRHRKS